MPQLLIKIIPVIISWSAFTFVIFYIEYPQTITLATPYQLLSFFIPLFLALTFTMNLFLKSLLSSLSASLGAVLMLFLQALDALNLVTSLLIIIAVGLFLSYFRKAGKDGLTYVKKIPKLRNLKRRRR